MSMMLIALALTLQPEPPQPSEPPLQEEFPAARGLTAGHDLFYDDVPVSTAEARVAMQRFGACVAQRSERLAADTVGSDFTTQTYRSRLQRLVRSNEDCFREGGRRMLSSHLLFAGAIAEALVERDSQPLNVRLARAAMRPATRAFSLSDQVAICVVRSLPDEVGRLMATEVGSSEEETAASALAPAFAACSPQNRRVESNGAGFRAILATAAYRSINDTAATASNQGDRPEAAE